MNYKHSDKTRRAVINDSGTNAEIAARHGVSVAWVGKLRASAGTPNTRKTKFAAKKSQALAMLANGATRAEVAKKLGVGNATVWSWDGNAKGKYVPKSAPRPVAPWISETLAKMEAAK